ncbi:hypothetical protein MLD38_026614 [Melastoma candidum]|uniref:Uncharacterized protein n=1 Tax=Melastoma candidum TaxID=119954 RepID=A0ACB9P0Q4_9MYRT|nr:hypothetical protein MLD38_026614 [Melastoma candidum]
MGEQKEGGAKSNSGGEGKKGPGKPAVVMKMEIHCDACAKKLKSLVRKSSGVDDVEIDLGANKLTVTGKVDPAKLREKLESKTHKKIELLSPLPAAAPAKDGGSEKKPEEKSEKKPEEKKPAPKESMVVLKIELHCEGCAKKIKRIISKFEGVSSVTIELAKDLVAVTGAMEVKDLVPYLQTKFKRAVELVPPKKDEGSAGTTNKKEKSLEPAVAAAHGGEKKKDEGKKADGGEKKGGDGGEKKKDDGEKKSVDSAKKEEKLEGGVALAPAVPKMEAQKMEYLAQPYQRALVPMPQSMPQYAMNMWQQGLPASGHQFWNADPYSYHGGYGNVNGGGYPGTHYGGDGYVMSQRVDAPQLFSDENPNACSVM